MMQNSVNTVPSQPSGSNPYQQQPLQPLQTLQQQQYQYQYQLQQSQQPKYQYNNNTNTNNNDTTISRVNEIASSLKNSNLTPFQKASVIAEINGNNKIQPSKSKSFHSFIPLFIKFIDLYLNIYTNLT
ncbi:unnamed protein product [[Candida] boidinii]|uniref:Unnamed protein product n=1 Tax=Candida boidinii TaxID=5477 RepID=A0A9W6WMK0_CANBO|nr:unnamed protein product [[Candida] boidinii]